MAQKVSSIIGSFCGDKYSVWNFKIEINTLDNCYIKWSNTVNWLPSRV